MLNQTRAIRDDDLRFGVKSFIFSKALPPASAKLRMITSTALISMDYRGF